MSATRCFSCIAFPFPRVVLGSKTIRASKAAPVKSQRSPARATDSGRATTPVPAASCWPFSVSVLTFYIEGQCRLLLYCNTHFKSLAYRKLRDRLPLFTELPRRFFPETRLPLNSILGNSGARRAKEGGRGFSVGASVFLLYDSPLREELHEGGESAGDIRSSDCNHPHRHLA